MLVVYDWDGTLADSEFKISEQTARIAAKAGFNISAQDVYSKFSGMHARDKFNAIARVANIPVTAAQLDEFEAEHMKTKEALYHRLKPDDLFPGAAEGVRKIYGGWHDLEICSNGEIDSLSVAVVNAKLIDLFTGINTPDSLNMPPKPSPEMLNHLRAKYNNVRSECVMIGDSTADMGAAKEAEYFYRVAFIGSNSAPERRQALQDAGATHFFKHHNELPALIGSLE